VPRSVVVRGGSPTSAGGISQCAGYADPPPSRAVSINLCSSVAWQCAAVWHRGAPSRSLRNLPRKGRYFYRPLPESAQLAAQGALFLPPPPISGCFRASAAPHYCKGWRQYAPTLVVALHYLIYLFRLRCLPEGCETQNDSSSKYGWPLAARPVVDKRSSTVHCSIGPNTNFACLKFFKKCRFA